MPHVETVVDAPTVLCHLADTQVHLTLDAAEVAAFDVGWLALTCVISFPHLTDSVGAYLAVPVVGLARLEHRHVLTDSHTGAWPPNTTVFGDGTDWCMAC